METSSVCMHGGFLEANRVRTCSRFGVNLAKRTMVRSRFKVDVLTRFESPYYPAMVTHIRVFDPEYNEVDERQETWTRIGGGERFSDVENTSYTRMRRNLRS